MISTCAIGLPTSVQISTMVNTLDIAGLNNALLEIARDPLARIRDIAAGIGITERTVQSIIKDLHEAGYLTRERAGRGNHYPTEADLPVRQLIDMRAALLPPLTGRMSRCRSPAC
ncbi:helix-turn-helix transcriptional regulator [Nonomuraea sp. NPDC059023]|uniref:helix-turn-helix transcriptional regulator n=1 Tax=unclassified Nonomuraea TaxID=2593643 RepID=UPI003681577B